MAKVKGASLCDSVKMAIQTHGQEGLDRVLNGMQPENREIMKNAIYSEWYPLDAYEEWLKIEIKEFCGGNINVFKQRTHKGVEQQFRGVYKVFLRLGSPENILKRLSVITAQYSQGITVDASILEKGKALLTYKGMEKRHTMIEISIVGWWEKVLEMMGARDIKVEVQVSVAEDKGHNTIVLTWKK